MDRHALRRWVRDYEAAWRAPGTEALDGLFTPDATYRTAPFEEPFSGLTAIRGMWEAERAGPDEEFALAAEVVAVEDDVGVVRAEVRYGPPTRARYRDLWIVRLTADGRCRSFEEWPFWPPGGTGGYAGGPARPER